MLRDNEKGYAIMTKDLKAYTGEFTNIETCKRYCLKNHVVVERIPVVRGYGIKVIFTKKFEWLNIYKTKDIIIIYFCGFQIILTKEYLHKNGKIVYEKL